MAINNQQINNSRFDIPANEYYFDKFRPYLEEVYEKSTSDEELCRTIRKAINAADTACVRGNYEGLSEAFDVLYVGITDKNYFNGISMQKATEEEKKLIRGIAEKIVDLRTIIKCEPAEETKPEKIRERLNYSPNGENLDFDSHNMAELNKCEPKQRIPNT